MSGSTIGDFAKEQAAKLLERLALQVTRTLDSPAADEVHDLRVAIRRVLSVLTVLKPAFPGDESRKIRRKLKKMMALAGSVRDRDIAIRLIRELTPSGPDPLQKQFRTERRAAAKALTASLQRWVKQNSSAQWREALESEAGEEAFCANTVEYSAQRILPRVARNFYVCGQHAACEKKDEKELHSFRIAAKNFRYTLDLFAPVYGPSTKGLTQQLKGVQTLLGEITDCAAVRRMVSRSKGGREILAALKKRQRKKIEKFRQDWTAAFASPEALRQWTDSLHHLASEPPAVPESATVSTTNDLALETSVRVPPKSTPRPEAKFRAAVG